MYEWWWSVTQLCPSLCNPEDCSPPGSSVHGILQARILEGVAISSSWRSSCYISRWLNNWSPKPLHLWERMGRLSKLCLNNKINQYDFSIDHLVMSICRVFSCVVERGRLLWPVCSLSKTLLAFALLHSVLQGQICLLLQIFLDLLLLHSSAL